MSSIGAALFALVLALSAGSTFAGVKVDGELREFHKVTLVFDGPEESEGGPKNPFEDYSLSVDFSKGGQTYNVLGYFAADGNAANTGATSGDKWHVHFAPPSAGDWSWKASFKTGSKVAIRGGGQPESSIDGMKGTLSVSRTNKGGVDNRGKGILSYVGKNHLRWSGNGKYFMKMGADSPENFLAFADFDNTPDNKGLRKSYSAHGKHFNSGDPTWGNGKGKNIIGAVNYMSSMGMNVQSFLTMNIGGDDKNVYPYVSTNDKRRFDVSKLAQWEIVFEHMDHMGMYLHFKMQERENDKMLNREERTLYHRELVARFAHHLALNWNIGEETTLSTRELVDYANEMRKFDAYNHHIVVHTHPGDLDKVYNPLLQEIAKGKASYTGFSLQNGSPSGVYRLTREWVQKSNAAGAPLVICSDEQGPFTEGIMPDSADAQHNDARKNVIWGNTMAGGGGVEAYFGYKFPQSDLTMEDFATRKNWWDQCRYAREFFDKFVPFWDTIPDDNVADGEWALAKKGSTYVVYLPNGGGVSIDLNTENDDFGIAWYDPKSGGALKKGSQTCAKGGSKTSVQAPSSGDDWVALLWKGCAQSPPDVKVPTGPNPVPEPEPKRPPEPKPEPQPQPGSDCFGEHQGNIVIQAEESELTAGWQLMDELSGFTGKGYIKYNAPNQYQWNQKDILSYEISATGGTYKINVYSARDRDDNCRSDECNDLYVLDGNQAKKLFTGFGPADNRWMWSTMFDVAHKKSPPLIELPAGKSMFRVAGRSKDYKVDMIVLQKQGSELETSGEVSPCGGGGGGGGGGEKTPMPTPEKTSPPAKPTHAPKTDPTPTTDPTMPEPSPTKGPRPSTPRTPKTPEPTPVAPNAPTPKMFSPLAPSNPDKDTCGYYYDSSMKLPTCQSHDLGPFEGGVSANLKASYEFGAIRVEVMVPSDYWVKQVTSGIYKTQRERGANDYPQTVDFDESMTSFIVYHDPMMIKARWDCCGNTMWLRTGATICKRGSSECDSTPWHLSRFDLECERHCTMKYPEDMSSGCPVCK